MIKKVLIISASPRRGGNSDTLCDEFQRGAKLSGNDTEKIFLGDYKIGHCIACNFCKTHDKCFQNDSMGAIMQKIINADVVVFATPVYFFAMCGQLKTFIDRLVAKYRDIENKKFYIIVACNSTKPNATRTVVNEIQGLVDCCANVEIGGVVKAQGVYNIGDVQSNKAIKEAFEMGKSV